MIRALTENGEQAGEILKQAGVAAPQLVKQHIKEAGGKWRQQLACCNPQGAWK